ncbi:Ig-like domain-containing protein [Aneurinibacillus thermoaerophilus]|uniref:Ig-like domain-containing protein n=1 Tax=Aneurinibacillus thermoaerophilus TaxID=143495 RepID=UPI002E251BD4|nr:Ig-like domain-containing protein [Aneurinibacillus thermoaerophilus]MED0736438.1 Ig-like domain-containing protein [Aneurinibacillus thermoaerophilus]MED0763101.1 Ig-like domain-containing protein [Aneurinibacillus thermoaerophilus]
MRKALSMGLLFCMMFMLFFTSIGNVSVRAENIADNDVAFMQYKTKMQKGHKETFTVNVDPSKADAVRWSVSDPNVLQLSHDRGNSVEVTALQEGKATITVYYEKGSRGDLSFPEPPSNVKKEKHLKESGNRSHQYSSLYVEETTEISGNADFTVNDNGYFRGNTAISGNPKVNIGKDSYFETVKISDNSTTTVGADAFFFKNLTISGNAELTIEGDAYFLDDVVVSGLPKICVRGTVYYKKTKPNVTCAKNIEPMAQTKTLSAAITVEVGPAEEQSHIGLNGTIDPKQQTIETQDGTAVGAVNVQLTPYGKPTASDLVREPVDIVFVLDRSGSMVRNENKMAKAKEATKHAIDLLADHSGSKSADDRIGLVSFSTEAEKLSDLTTHFDTVKKRVEWVHAVGWTNYWAALHMAKSMFANSTNRKYIIFLTDGVPTHGKGKDGGTEEWQIEKALRDAEEAARELADNSIKLYSIGFGRDVRMKNLERLSSLTGGAAYEGTMDNLKSLFAQITNKIKQISLGEVKVKVKLPSSDVQLAPDTDAVVDESGYVTIRFPDVPYTENGPAIDANELKKALKLKFLKEGTYSFTDVSLSYKTFNGNVVTKPLEAFTITVVPQRIPVSGIVLNKTKLDMDIDPDPNTVPETHWTEQLTAEVKPSNATNKKVIWSSTDESVATVDENGKVTAKGVGTAQIVARTEDGGKEARCNVHVRLTPLFKVKSDVIGDNAYVVIQPQKDTILPTTAWYVKEKGKWKKLTAKNGYFEKKQMVVVLDKKDGQPVKTDLDIWAVTLDKTVQDDSNPDGSKIPEDKRHGERKIRNVLDPEGNKIEDYIEPLAEIAKSPKDNRAASVKAGYKVKKLPQLVHLRIVDMSMILENTKTKNTQSVRPEFTPPKELSKGDKGWAVPKLLKAPNGKTATYDVKIELIITLQSTEDFNVDKIDAVKEEGLKQFTASKDAGKLTIKGTETLQ